jgi:hypothetical protein
MDGVELLMPTLAIAKSAHANKPKKADELKRIRCLYQHAQSKRNTSVAELAGLNLITSNSVFAAARSAKNTIFQHPPFIVGPPVPSSVSLSNKSCVGFMPFYVAEAPRSPYPNPTTGSD